MDPLNFTIAVIIISASGALAPGPLFIVTITHGSKKGAKSGIIFSIAHSIIEFLLIMLLAFGLLSFANESSVKLFVGIAGGTALIIFGIMQVRSFLQFSKERKTEETSSRNLFLIGLALTGLNPYFIIWWLTIGANLILLAFEFAGMVGVLFMYTSHVWIDYVWLTFLSTIAKRGTKILRIRWYRTLIAIFGLILIYFGLYFIIDAIGL